MLVFLAVFAVASIQIYNWFDADLFTALMIVLLLPLVLIAKRIWTKRPDWVLTPKEFTEDVFWLAGAVFIWYPFYTDYYHSIKRIIFNENCYNLFYISKPIMNRI